jgi:benzodiazapine receptor
MNFKRIGILIGTILLCQTAGGIGSLFTFDSITTWYAGLQKPFFTPPNFVFGPVWITLYTLMGIALFLVLWVPKSKEKNTGLMLFGGQLVLNTLWTIVFFGLHEILIAFVMIVALWAFILLNIYWFWKIEKRAAYLLVPYLAWVTIASTLNLGILLLNP